MSCDIVDAFGGSGRRRSRRFRSAWPVVGIVAIVLAAGCGPAATPRMPTFALSIRNASDAAVRLKVLVVSEGLPEGDLLIPARSGILSTPPRAMDVADAGPEPIVVEVYTDTCARLTSVSIGEGRTQIVINADRSVTTSAEIAGPASGAVEPALVPAC
jgi:hypothetical protein